MKHHFLRTTGRLALILLFVCLLPVPSRAVAQNNGLYYTVRSGDSLTQIARAFHTTSNRLLLLNYMPDPNQLNVGQTLYIPGFEDVQGEVVRTQLPIGMTPSSYNSYLHLPDELVYRLNFVTNPEAFYGGQSYFKINKQDQPQKMLEVTSGMSSLELAARQGVSPWTAADFNNLHGTWDLVQNETLFLPSTADETGAAAIAVSPLPLPQGKTVVFTMPAAQLTGLTGSLAGYPLNFFPGSNNDLVALQGIPRLYPPGMTTLVLTKTNPDGSTFSVQQNLLVSKQDYGVDAPFQVADYFVDPAVTEPELAQVTQIVTPAPPEKLWSGAFASPSPYKPECLTSTFGRLRSYNGSDYTFFHSGLDFCGNNTTEIYAAAPGIVVYTGKLTVRGNATIISHGWGVYTGYWHQSEIRVNVGDRVETGQVIGLVGDTGRVTGPHLHFEVFVGSVQVDPMDWLHGGIGGL